MSLAQMVAEASAWTNPVPPIDALKADGSPASLISPESVAPLVPLFAPYCGGLLHQVALEESLSLLLAGSWTGRRLLQGGRSHPLQLSWSGKTAPQDVLHCDLIFPALPQVSYAFDLPCYQLVQWLMEREGEELPSGFWRWLLLGQSCSATKAMGSSA